MKNKKVRRIVTVLLVLVLVTSAGMLLFQNYQYSEGDKVYQEAEELVQLPDLTDLPMPTVPGPDEGDASDSSTPFLDPDYAVIPSTSYVDPYADALAAMDFSALQEVNKDVLGWILVPGSRISYPIVQGSNNTYYLNHTWRKGYNSVGAIFLECTNSRDLSDFNTIIYGHRMNNRSMFGILHNFQEQSYWEQHPYVYITDDYGSHRYDIFAAYEVSVEGDTYRLGFSGDRAKQNFIDYCLSLSVIDTGVVPTVNDKILTMSTCTGHGHATRWVVQAVLRTEQPKTDPEPAPETPPDSSTPQTQPDSSQQTPPDTSAQPAPEQTEQPPEQGPAPDQSAEAGHPPAPEQPEGEVQTEPPQT